MNGSQMTDGQQIDMQGIIGAAIGRALGGFLGNRIGGSTGRTIGGIAGGFGGGLLPFSTGPEMGQASDLEMQGFLSTLRRLAPTILSTVQTGFNFGHGLGPSGAGPGQA